MIFTIGYDGKDFTPNHLAKILDDAQAVLIDVRLTPFSRIKGWGTSQLKEAIGEHRYISRKDLGGGVEDKSAGLEFLQQYATFGLPNAILLCKEENPGECHRHMEITAGNDLSKQNFPEALHIFREGIYRESELDDFLENGAELEAVCLTEHLPDLIVELAKL